MTAIEQAVAGLTPGDHRIKCPLCHHTRKKKHDKELSVTVEADGSVVWHCWHCEEAGALHKKPTLERRVTVPVSSPEDTKESVKRYLTGRGVAEDVLTGRVRAGRKYINGREQVAVGFDYPKNKATKWRAIGEKGFTQSGVCKDFFLLDDAEVGNRVLICEGEMDALAWLTAGLPDDVSVLAVPNGAPSRPTDEVREDQRKFQYLYNARELLEKAPALILNLDNDKPGKILEQEIRRRVTNPNTLVVDLKEEKDAADYIRTHGPAALRERFESAAHPPLKGVHSANEYIEEILHRMRNGDQSNPTTGLRSVDAFTSFPLGMVTTMTGIPGSGKSNFIDQIVVNMALQHGWKSLLCSFEKVPRRHIPELVQKITGEPWRSLPEERVQATVEWLGDHIFLMDRADRSAPDDIDGILDQARTMVLKEGIRLIVIDPYNYLSQSMPDGSELSETNFVKYMMKSISDFAKQYDVHIVLVAHPQKPKISGFGEDYDVPTGYAISGSANFYNATDLGITMHRDSENRNFLHVWKVRFSDLGQLGNIEMRFDPKTETWHDTPNWRVVTEKIVCTFPELEPTVVEPDTSEE